METPRARACIEDHSRRGSTFVGTRAQKVRFGRALNGLGYAIVGLTCGDSAAELKEDAVAKGDISTYNEDGTWKSRVEGSARAAHVGGTKAEQQAVGKQMAKDRGVEHTVRKMDGTIGEKNSYGNDPNPPKG